MANNFEAGKLGEHICMTRLMKMGISCQIVNLDTIDIIVHYDQSIIRVQVKSSILKTKGFGKGRPGYQFATSYSGKKKPLTEEHCDIIAFVAVNDERVLFSPVTTLTKQVTRRISPSKFQKNDLEVRSWQHCLDCIFLTD